jgi:uncharacterized damage-inducible protein DinB
MITLTFDELLSYTDEEREKWHAWLQAQPAALDITLQPGGRFATVGALVDHIFLVEARHLARLQQQPVPDASGVPPGDVDSLFKYGRKVRQALRAYAVGVSESDARTGRDFVVQSGTFRMTPRKLLLHIGLHETRHWAQIALGIRQAGLAPPGNHDLFYSRAME